MWGIFCRFFRYIRSGDFFSVGTCLCDFRRHFEVMKITQGQLDDFVVRTKSPEGTSELFGWTCAAGTLEPLAYTRAATGERNLFRKNNACRLTQATTSSCYIVLAKLLYLAEAFASCTLLFPYPVLYSLFFLNQGIPLFKFKLFSVAFIKQPG